MPPISDDSLAKASVQSREGSAPCRGYCRRRSSLVGAHTEMAII